MQTGARYPGTLSRAQAERGCQLLYNSSDTKGVGWVSTHTLLNESGRDLSLTLRVPLVSE